VLVFGNCRWLTSVFTSCWADDVLILSVRSRNRSQTTWHEYVFVSVITDRDLVHRQNTKECPCGVVLCIDSWVLPGNRFFVENKTRSIFYRWWLAISFSTYDHVFPSVGSLGRSAIPPLLTTFKKSISVVSRILTSSPFQIAPQCSRCSEQKRRRTLKSSRRGFVGIQRRSSEQGVFPLFRGFESEGKWGFPNHGLKHSSSNSSLFLIPSKSCPKQTIAMVRQDSTGLCRIQNRWPARKLRWSERVTSVKGQYFDGN
jgi:hypothetical protein